MNKENIENLKIKGYTILRKWVDAKWLEKFK